MDFNRLPIFDNELRDCESIYFDIVQLLDEWELFQNKVQQFCENNMRYDRTLSENPNDCWVSTLTNTQQAMCEEILNPSSELIQLFDIDVIEQVYDNKDHALLNKIHFIIKNVIDEYIKMSQYYICMVL